MKIIKNRMTFTQMALRELKIIDFLNKQVDPKDICHIIRKYDHFMFKNHICIIFELLTGNLFELLVKNNYVGLSLKTISFIMKQILEGVYQFQKIDVIHCDLKPENILIKIKKNDNINIKITDFGSACFDKHTIATYIQSRYYRAPEVLLTYPYSIQIDAWSIGCVAAELFIGTPLFPGCNEYDQISKIIHTLGNVPEFILHNSKKRDKFFFFERNHYRLKTQDEYYKVLIYKFRNFQKKNQRIITKCLGRSQVWKN